VGGLAVVLGAENLMVMDWYAAEDNEEALGGNLLVRERADIFDRLWELTMSVKRNI